MNVPIHPKICACPWACRKAGDRLSSAWRLLIEIRFQTPRNVPGNSRKMRPVRMYAINMRCIFISRLTAASWKALKLKLARVEKTRLKPLS